MRAGSKIPAFFIVRFSDFYSCRVIMTRVARDACVCVRVFYREEKRKKNSNFFKIVLTSFYFCAILPPSPHERVTTDRNRLTQTQKKGNTTMAMIHADASVLTAEQINTNAPSVFAEDHAGKLSRFYRQIPTHAIVSALESEGFVVTGALDYVPKKHRHTTETEEQTPQNRLHNKHLIRMTHVDKLGANPNYRNDLVISSSHNGLASFKATLGILRFACSNGMIAFDESPAAAGFSIKYRHNNPDFTLDQIIADCMRLGQRSNELDELIKEMGSIRLTDKQIAEFSRQATFIRHARLSEASDPKELARYDFMRMVQPRRIEDEGKDLFTILNVAQENGVKGGFTIVKAGEGKQRAIGELTNPSALLQFNQDIWSLAENFRTGHMLAA